MAETVVTFGTLVILAIISRQLHWMVGIFAPIRGKGDRALWMMLRLTNTSSEGNTRERTERIQRARRTCGCL